MKSGADRRLGIRVKCGAAILILALLVLSLKSLTTFPEPFDDEGLYASFGHGYFALHKFYSDAIHFNGPFDHGNALGSRLNPLIFGVVGKLTGLYSLATARMIAFAWIWAAAGLWVLIARRLGLSGVVGAAIFLFNERIFYASHVFRPESALVFFNSLLILAILKDETAATEGSAFGRGLLNSTFVVAHGNGLVSALLNSAVQLRTKLVFRRLGIYALGSVAAILIFYLVQIRDVGGWSVARQQFQGMNQYQVKGTLLSSIHADLTMRWGRELFEVGGGSAARVLRILYYIALFAISVFNIAFLRGRPRVFGILALACVAGYAVFVQDKIDIHISEMMPFLLVSVLAWFAELKENRVAQLALTAIVLAGLSFCLHHSVAYIGPSSADRTIAAVDRYLAEKNPSRPTFLGDMQYWFRYGRENPFVSAGFADHFTPLRGEIVVLMKRGRIPMELYQLKTDVLASCRLVQADPDRLFSAYTCAPTNQP